jgi:hypothetical protein
MAGHCNNNERTLESNNFTKGPLFKIFLAESDVNKKER